MNEPNPKLYRELSEPHESVESLNTDLNAFFADFGELRKKYRLRDVVAIVNTSYLAKDGEEIEGGTHVGYGNSMNHEMMLAHCLGQVQSERQEAMARMLSKGISRGKRQD